MTDFGHMLPVACLLAREVARVPEAERLRAKAHAEAMRSSASPTLRLALLRIFREPDWAHEDAPLLDSVKTRAADWTVFRSATDRRVLEAVLARLSDGVHVLYPGPIVDRLGKDAIVVLERHIARLKGVEPFTRNCRRALAIARS
jgi:hypothetical protein